MLLDSGKTTILHRKERNRLSSDVLAAAFLWDGSMWTAISFKSDKRWFISRCRVFLVFLYLTSNEPPGGAEFRAMLLMKSPSCCSHVLSGVSGRVQEVPGSYARTETMSVSLMNYWGNELKIENETPIHLEADGRKWELQLSQISPPSREDAWTARRDFCILKHKASKGWRTRTHTCSSLKLKTRQYLGMNQWYNETDPKTLMYKYLWVKCVSICTRNECQSTADWSLLIQVFKKLVLLLLRPKTFICSSSLRLFCW